jgi:hypothetical protein
VRVEPRPSIEFKKVTWHFLWEETMKEKIMMAAAVALFSLVPFLQLITAL